MIGCCFVKFDPGKRPGRAGVVRINWRFIDVVLIASQILFRVFTARHVGVVEMGRIVLVSSYAGLAWSILAPLVLAAVIVFLRAVPAHRAHT